MPRVPPTLSALSLTLLLTACGGNKCEEIVELTPEPLLQVRESEEATPSRMVHLIRNGYDRAAWDLYDQLYKQTGRHNFSLVQEMAVQLLERGARDSNPETQMLSLYGASLAVDERTAPIVASGIHSRAPFPQVAALHTLARWGHPKTDWAIQQAFRSHFLHVQLEAAHLMAQRQLPKARGQIEGLMHRVPDTVRPLIPRLLAMIGDQTTTAYLRKIMMTEAPRVRAEAVLAAAREGLDQLLPEIRDTASHLHPMDQEASAMALGLMGDSGSLPRLREFTRSSAETVQVAAWWSLHKLGQKDAQEQLSQLALQGNLFAIGTLGQIPGCEATLTEILDHPDRAVRCNASLALLSRGDARGLKHIDEVLLVDDRDLAILPAFSPAGSLQTWSVTPSAKENFQKNPMAYELATRVREQVLVQASQLKPEAFVPLCDRLLAQKQNELVPMITRLLEDLNTPDSVEVLKRHQQDVGAPLIRTYCTLSLLRLGEPGPHREALLRWVTRSHRTELIQFRPVLPWDVSLDASPHDLTPKEESRLLIEAFETLAMQRDEKGIEALLYSMREGHPQNRYALAGLLLQASQ